ncbi:hypothetical protein [Frigoribacterium sp. UYMn621]|uniref:hypothetical protein n=1 Tax=Frigoribacterium sp. UYMn621 TaxID=3156343 RepID=UPI00339B6D3A
MPVKLPSGEIGTGIRHKNLMPAPGPGTPSAGPVAESPAPSPKSIIAAAGLHRDTRSEFNADGFNADGFGEYGFDKAGFDANGFDEYGIHRETGNRFGPANYDRRRDRGYTPGPNWEADQEMVNNVRGESQGDFPKGFTDDELIVRYHELLLIEATKFPYDPGADTYIVGAGEAQYRQAANVTWGAWGEVEDRCFWDAALELSDRAAERKRKRDSA